MSCEPAPLAGKSAPVGTLRGAGGVALLPYIQSAAKDFLGQHPQVVAQIAESRSSAAIRSLIEGSLDFAFTSRSLRAADVEEGKKKAKQLHMVVIGAEALAVIVHPSNPLQDISVEQLRKTFFSGKIRDWAELTAGTKSGPIKVFAINPKTSGTGELFVTMITGEDKAQYIPEATMLDYSDDSIARIAADPNAISFSGMGNVNASVKPVTINGVIPTEKSILDTSYLLNRKLFVITDGPPKGLSREFVKFLLSDAGQHLARAKGITPIVLE